VRLQLKEILPYVTGITHEYKLASGKPASMCRFSLGYVVEGGVTYPQVTLHDIPGGHHITRTQARVLRSFRPVSGAANTFRGSRLGADHLKETRAQLATHLIYRIHPQHSVTPVCSKRLELMEELPIALLFFYMSSVVRYKPEFFTRLRDSRYWPVLSSARTHSFHAFLLAFWSFMHQQNYFVNPDL